jgi:hypothetical protein
MSQADAQLPMSPTAAARTWDPYPHTVQNLSLIATRLDEIAPEIATLRSICARLVGTYMRKQSASPCERIQLIGLGRVVDAFEATLLLVRAGAVIDARSVAASLYEMAYLMNYVRNDTSRAKHWLEAGIGGGQAFSVFAMVKDVHESGLVDGTAEVAYDGMYDMLCAAKHNSAAEIGMHYLPIDATTEAVGFGGFCQVDTEDERMSTIVIGYSLIMLAFGAHSAARLLNIIEAAVDIRAVQNVVHERVDRWMGNRDKPEEEQVVERVRKRKATQAVYAPRKRRK